MQKAQGKVELTCESCHRETTPVEAFCRNCALFICQHCEEAHRTMRAFSDHVVVPLDDLRQNTAAHLPVKEEAQIRCKEHGGEEMKLYCYDCKQLICRDCIVIDHKGHEYNFVNKAAVQCRASLKESVAPLRETKRKIGQVLKEVELMELKLDSTVARDIDRPLDNLISLLQKRKVQLHQEAEQLVENKQKTLLAQKKNAQLATAEIQSLLDFVDHKSQQASDQEVLGLQKQITDRAEEVAQKYGNPKKQFGPTNIPCLKVQCIAETERMVKQKINISETTISVEGGQHILRPIVGKQPQGGRMTHMVCETVQYNRAYTHHVISTHSPPCSILPQVLCGQSLPGYKGYNTIKIDYNIPGGVQGEEHPNPGRPFSGTSRTAYLPDTYEGREVLEVYTCI